MKAIFALIACGAVAAPIVSVAQESTGQEPAKLSCIKDVTYSHDFLAKYPRAPAGCREVEMRDGMKWIRFQAKVVRMKGNKVTADFIDNHDQPIATLTFASTDPNERVEVDGKNIKFSQLKRDDELTFWVPESRFGFYASPLAQQKSKLTLVSDETALR